MSATTSNEVKGLSLLLSQKIADLLEVVIGLRLGFWIFLLESLRRLNDAEVDDEGKNDERDESGQELAIVDANDVELIEVGLTAELADDVHEDLGELRHDSGECTTHDERNSKLDEVATHKELLKALHFLLISGDTRVTHRGLTLPMLCHKRWHLRYQLVSLRKFSQQR